MANANQRYDLEALLNDIASFIQLNLPGKITQVNNDKNDGIVLAPIDNNAYFLQSLNNNVAVYDPFILYGVSAIAPNSIGPNTSKKYTINVVIVLQDQKDLVTARRVFRYSRALEEVFEENWGQIGNRGKFTVSSLEPVNFSLINSSEEYRAVGVSIEAWLV